MKNLKKNEPRKDSGKSRRRMKEPGGDITDANDAFLQMVGYTRHDVLSGVVHWRDMLPEEYKHLVDIALDEVASTEAITPIETTYIHTADIEQSRIRQASLHAVSIIRPVWMRMV